MTDFNPIDKIINSAKILLADSSWPSFDKSHLVSLSYKRGNYQRDIGGFDEPTIDTSIEFSYDEPSFIIDLQFHKCSSYIFVEIGTSNRTAFTSFKCFQVEVIGKTEISGDSYAQPIIQPVLAKACPIIQT